MLPPGSFEFRPYLQAIPTNEGGFADRLIDGEDSRVGVFEDVAVDFPPCGVHGLTAFLSLSRASPAA